MDSLVAPIPESSSLPDVQIPAWAWMIVAFAATAIYFVTMENGAALGSAAGTLHEFFHDGRHFSAIPCH